MNVDFFAVTYCGEGGYYATLILILAYALWRRKFKKSLPWLIFTSFLCTRLTQDVIIMQSSHLIITLGNALYFKTVDILDITAFGFLFLTTYMLVISTVSGVSEVDVNSNFLQNLKHTATAVLAVLPIAGIILGGIGQSNVMLQDGLLTEQGHSLTKASLAFYSAVYVVTVVIHILFGVLFWSRVSQRVFTIMSVVLVLLLVRLVYRWLDEVGGKQWSPLDGTWGFYLALGGIPEWSIAGLYIILSFITRPRPPPAPEIFYVRQLNVDQVKSTALGAAEEDTGDLEAPQII